VRTWKSWNKHGKICFSTSTWKSCCNVIFLSL
jgi:hypothetical protein